MTVERFHGQWGRLAGLTKKQVGTLWSAAEEQYIDLPYHNFPHAVDALQVAMILTDVCEGHGKTPDRKALAGAALFHDAGYHKDSGNHDSKESYSAAIFAGLAPSAGYGESEIAIGRQAIMATKVGAKPESIEDKILLRADLNNVCGDYLGSFLVKTRLLWQEARLLEERRGYNVSDVTFILNSLKVLRGYFANDLSLGEFEKDSWRGHAATNLRILGQEVKEELKASTANDIQKFGKTAVAKLLRIGRSDEPKDPADS